MGLFGESSELEFLITAVSFWICSVLIVLYACIRGCCFRNQRRGTTKGPQTVLLTMGQDTTDVLLRRMEITPDTNSELRYEFSPITQARHISDHKDNENDNDLAD